jgi:hypothetical protein
MTKSKGIIIKDPVERFWKNVSVVQNKFDCLEWIGRTSYKGYGVMKINNKTVQAHRFSYQIHKGTIPDGMLVCHLCDNPKCVSPSHLFLGTIQDNNLDRDRKQRNALGERNGKSKLTLDDVRKIKRLYQSGYSTKEIVKIMNLNHSTVTNIKLGRSWRWVEKSTS